MAEIVLVTGANGQLGREFQVLSAQFPHFEFHFFDHSILDISDKEALENAFVSIKPDYVLNCAAYTAVDKAESEQELAFKINSDAVELLAEVTQNFDSKLIHFSTDYVFDGNKNTPYSETDPTNPINVYGHCKLAGEKKLSEHPNALIIRTSWLYSSFGSNFVKTMLRLAENRSELRVVCDQLGTPTYAHDLAKMVLNNLTKLGELGNNIYHYSNEGVCSWYDFAHAIFDISGKDMKLYPVRTEDYPTAAARPIYTVLDKRKIKSLVENKIPYWRNSLKECIDLIKENNE
ncbi:MAG: dTDP-4-dehydrorhamnose reductase [Chitinophagales bacterium]